MAESDTIYIGIQGAVLALDPSTGNELWKSDLDGSSFVNVTLQGGKIIAATKGEIFALDPATGKILWNNTLKGLGLGFVTIAGGPQAPTMAALNKKDQSDGGAAAAAAGT